MLRYIFISISLLPLTAAAQRQVMHHQLVWAGYYNTTVFSKRVSIMSDMQVRTQNWLSQWSAQLVRSGLTYNVSNKLSLTGGFAFFRTAHYNQEAVLFKKEWRPWQELSVKLEKKNKTLVQRLRTEQRFLQQVQQQKLTPVYHFLFRLRYKADLQLPIKNTPLAVGLGNEIMVHPTKTATPDFFDQNRAAISLYWKLSPATNLQWQYIKIIQNKYGTPVTDLQDVVRFNVHHQIKWKN